MRIITILVLVLVLNISCQKNNDISNATFQLHFVMDGVEYSTVLGKGMTNGISAVEYGASGGTYRACGSIFGTQNLAFVDIRVGGIIDKGPADFASTYKSFKSNFAPGNKPYEPLVSVPSTESGNVEIEYRDEQGVYWSSTTYTNNLSTAVINQPTGKFTILYMSEVKSRSSMHRDLIIKGTFSCKLYQVDGPGVKDLQNGSFVALAEL